MTFTQYEQLKHRHDQLAAQFNETESEDILTEIAVIEVALYTAGYLNYGEEPFADDTPAAASEQEQTR